MDLLPAFGWTTVLTQAHFTLLPTGLLILAAGWYWLGVRRLAARDDRWPVARSTAFAAGLLVLAVATVSGLATYDEHLFGADVVQHTLLSTVAPGLLALGAPVRLALCTLGPRGGGRLLSVLHARAVRLLTYPLLSWVLFVGSPFALYFSGWYAATLDSPALETLLHAQFLAVGWLFYASMVGAVPRPGRAGYPFRMMLLAAMLPAHAFLGLAIMSVSENGEGLIAAAHFRPLHGLRGSVFQQRVGGGVLWAAGDVVALLFLGVVLVRWMHASERDAEREDRRLDRLEGP